MKKVLRMQWIGLCLGEDETPIVRNGVPSADSPWWSLAQMQQKILASAADSVSPVLQQEEQGHNKIQQLLTQPKPAQCEIVSRNDESGVIVIPAAACRDAPNKKVLLFKCFMGGQQLFLQQDAVVQYVLPKQLIPLTTQRFKLSCRVCTAHRKEQPILLTVGSETQQGTIVVVKLPYTMGLWEWTEPVIIEIGGSGVEGVTLRLSRPQQHFGFSFKDIELVPC
jgi:hypothetical protein